MNTTKHDLFYGIKESEQSEMLKCFNSYTRSYSAGEIICFFDEPDAGIGIVEEGEACIIHSLSNGSQTILEHLKPGDLFGQMFYYHANRENITLEASKKCTIRYIDYQHIVKRCIKSCQHHSQLVSNILMMVSDKTQDICEHLEAVSQRSIRDKLMTYFETLSSKNNSNTFTIPFTMSSLADYLSIDRSAMSRELGKMKDEGLIYIEKREVTINRFK
ncbi:Crp/Fnr family transcriptional regulator [Eubacterium sp.]|uniref:Crp/Fnr family transcriptional regulator n=1 Tax=Eubacterium sp. TaxID=142586 RepID=UPI0039998839